MWAITDDRGGENVTWLPLNANWGERTGKEKNRRSARRTQPSNTRCWVDYDNPLGNAYCKGKESAVVEQSGYWKVWNEEIS